MRTRWISYTSQIMPGNQSFELEFHASLADAETAYEAFCYGVGTDECYSTLYAVPQDDRGPEMIESAKEFEDVGCPFDYPDRIIERGPRGGVVRSRT